MTKKSIVRGGTISIIDMAVTDVIAMPLEPDSQLLDETTRNAIRDIASAQIVADELDDTTVAALSGAFDPWEPGESVSPGPPPDLRFYKGTVVECIQAHTTQEDWPPDATPALWKVHRAVGEVMPWTQPQGAHDAYQIEPPPPERVTHNGRLWENTTPDNVWEPGVFGWIDLGPA